jgi:hypothetical protein
MQSTFANATPGVGAVLGAVDGANGEDSVTGEKLTYFQRGMGLLAAVPFVGGMVKTTGRVAKASRAVDKVADAIGHAPVRTAADDVLGQVDKVFLERLRLGSRVEVPAGTTGIRKLMSDISVVTGNEVALIRDKFGTRWLAQGGPNELILPPNTVRVIAHTHPQGSLRLSGADLKAFSNPLRQNQRSTVLISPREDFGVRVPIPRNGGQ